LPRIRADYPITRRRRAEFDDSPKKPDAGEPGFRSTPGWDGRMTPAAV
jgi:hypothetical protein